MRRTANAIRKGDLLPIERTLLVTLRDLGEAHGYAIRDHMGHAATSRSTTYRALRRLDAAGLIVSTWEDATLANAESRPQRRVYRLVEQREDAA